MPSLETRRKFSTFPLSITARLTAHPLSDLEPVIANGIDKTKVQPMDPAPPDLLSQLKGATTIL